MSEFKLPTETIELPSKGLLYPEDSELSKGTIELKYMTAKEQEVDLSVIENKELKEELFKNRVNEFSFTLPHSKNKITFKLLTHKDEQRWKC